MNVDESNATLTADLNKVKKSELIQNILSLQKRNIQNETKLNEIVAQKKQIEQKVEQLIMQVAKWENDKNTLTNMLIKEYESKELDIIKGVVDVVDKLDSICAAMADASTIAVIRSTTTNLLQRFTLVRIEKQQFDPQYHIAANKIEHGKKVLQYITHGYTYKDKIIRFATVLLD